MAQEIVKEYTNGDLVVVWKPQKCIHSEICVKTLPQVYNPEEKPWIKAENASQEALKDQISKCPSAALTFYMKGEKQQEASQPSSEIPVSVVENGPLLVQGTLKVALADGSEEIQKRSTAFCRCGHSENKPYCDGSHGKMNFVG